MTIYAFEGDVPEIAEDTWVAPDANVIGKVHLAARVGIWFGVTLRGDNEPIVVGEGTNLQENVVCHTDMGFPLTIGANCTIGHKAMIHGCTIGEGTLVGMGATVMNGAQIGRNCIIGAGALVTERKVIPDGSLVLGAPGSVKRALSEAEIASNYEAAEAYVVKLRRFRAGLRAVDGGDGSGGETA